MPITIAAYNRAQDVVSRAICIALVKELTVGLPKAESKLWHAHPVWFLEGNPIAGYSVQKSGVRLLFWSGADFAEPLLQPGSGKFKDASILYTSVEQIRSKDVQRWLKKARTIQWDYKHIVKRKGKLVRLP